MLVRDAVGDPYQVLQGDREVLGRRPGSLLAEHAAVVDDGVDHRAVPDLPPRRVSPGSERRHLAGSVAARRHGQRDAQPRRPGKHHGIEAVQRAGANADERLAGGGVGGGDVGQVELVDVAVAVVEDGLHGVR